MRMLRRCTEYRRRYEEACLASLGMGEWGLGKKAPILGSMQDDVADNTKSTSSVPEFIFS